MASISARTREPRAGRPLLAADYSKFESGRRKLLSWKWAVDRLRRAHTYWIVTVRPDGRPHAVPIWGVWLDDKFVFGTDANSIKVRNLKADPRCEICLEENSEALTLEGEARQLEDPATISKMARAYKTKYDWAIDLSAGPFYQIAPHRVLAYAEARFPDSATRWEFAKTSPMAG
jgi:PPOX class probable F420-dependent enzyme